MAKKSQKKTLLQRRQILARMAKTTQAVPAFINLASFVGRSVDTVDASIDTQNDRLIVDRFRHCHSSGRQGHDLPTEPSRNSSNRRNPHSVGADTEKMSTSGQRDDAGSDNEEEETSDAKIERLATENEELKASLIGVPELSDEWFRITTDIKDRHVERLLLIEKKRCDEVVKEYFEENPHVVEAVPECPVCLEKMWDLCSTVLFECCGKEVCKECVYQERSVFETCPLCRGKASGPVESISRTKEKADSGIAWAQAHLGQTYLYGENGVPKDVDKALPLLREAAQNGSTDAFTMLGEYYFGIENYEEARQCYEAAAAKGEMKSLFQLGMMMRDGQAFDQNEQTRAQALRLITVSAALCKHSFNRPALELSDFCQNFPPVHYLRPALEEGKATVGAMENYARALIYAAEDYYGKNYASAPPGHNPVPEALFWHRQYSRINEPDLDNPLTRLERAIRESCARCRVDLPEGKPSCCVECKAAYYCNRDCQVAHWKAGHKKDCVRKLKKRLKAAGTPFVEP